MSTASPSPFIRHAGPDEYPRLREIEKAGDEMFMAHLGLGPLPNGDFGGHLIDAAVVLVAGDPAVGFASVTVVDGEAHLAQLSVDPASGRRGIGTALVAAVCDWARSQNYAAVSLTAFRDIPWNAPFYTRLGFRVIDQLAPQIAAVRDHERAQGDDALGARVAMRKDLLSHSPLS